VTSGTANEAGNPNVTEKRQVSWAWLALAAALAAAAWLTNTIIRQPLGLDIASAHAVDLQPGLGLAQPWRLLSAAFLHWDTAHLTTNILGAAALALLGWSARMSRAAALAWCLAWPLTHLLLLGLGGIGATALASLGLPANVSDALTKVPSHFGGLSGVLHAGASVVAVWLVLTNHDAKRWAGAALLACLVAKVGWESWHPARILGTVADGGLFTSVTAAHAAGLLAGTLCAVVVLAVLEAGRGPPAASHRALDSEL
jgi:hypothetical protein